ncbi:MAG: PilZ domain-containing protein [Vicinamibacteria bacterium]
MEPSRRAPRFTLSARVEGLAQFWTDILVVDVSPTGALIESSRFLEASSVLTLQLTLAEAPLSIRARVVHCTRLEPDVYRAGVRFDALPSELLERIRELIRSSLQHERREQPRVFVGQQGQLRKEVELRVLNLSLFGGLFSVGNPLEFESEHDFVFSLPAGQVHARGVVRHCEAWALARDAAIFRVGVEFTNLAGDDRKRVVHYLDEQTQAP